MSRWSWGALVVQAGCLLGGVASAYVVWKNVSGADKSTHAGGLLPGGQAPRDREYEAMKLRLASLESQLDQLGAKVISRDASPAAEEGSPSAEKGTDGEASADNSTALSEEQLIEEAKKQSAATFAYLEKRFADEPMDQATAAAEVRAIQERFKNQDKFRLAGVECRYTMCRMELKGEVTSVAEIESVVDLHEGGTATLREDGTVLVFTGRDGFPFHETNHPG